MGSPFPTSHSADVKLWLDCAEHGRFALGRITRTEIEMATVASAGIPPCEADLIVLVDGEDVRRRVRLASGLAKGDRVASVIPVDGVAPF